MGGDPAAEKKQRRDVPTVKKWAATYRPQVLKFSKSPRNILRYLDMMEAAIGNTRICDVKPRDLEAIRAKLTPTTANRFRQAVSPFFKAAIAEGFITVNPTTSLRKYDENEPRERVFTDGELGKIFEAANRLADPHARAAILFLAATGCRLSEALNAKWSDVDLDGPLPLVTLHRTKAKRSQKIFLPADLVKVLRTLPRIGSFIVAGKNPARPRRDLKRPWTKVCQDAGLQNANLHDLRRTFTRLAARIAGVHLASRAARHSTVTVTEKHYLPEDAQATAAVVEKVGRVLPFSKEKIA